MKIKIDRLEINCNMKKKIVVIFLYLCLLSGCANNEKKVENTPAPTNVSTQTPTATLLLTPEFERGIFGEKSAV